MMNNFGVEVSYIVVGNKVFEKNISFLGKSYSFSEIEFNEEEKKYKMKNSEASLFGTLMISNEDDFNDMANSIINKAVMFKFKIDLEEDLMEFESADEAFSYLEEIKGDAVFPDQPTLEELVLTEDTKEGILECLDFAKNAEKYIAIGARRPKGILLNGKPGTGKTSIAIAIAIESGSEFIYASGSEFVEKYVGVGAKRVRELFEGARKKERAIIFIDEIDAIGSKREDENSKEDNKTLNQLLIEMDGFKKDDNIMVIAATNRKDLLDSALLRPGRFDRHYNIDLPTEEMREEIINLYISKVKHDKISDSFVKEVAKNTEGMSGADLSNLINEAAIYAVRKNSEVVKESHIEHSLKVQTNKDIKKKRIVGFLATESGAC